MFKHANHTTMIHGTKYGCLLYDGLRSINQKIEAILIYLPNFAFSSSLRVLKLSCACNAEDRDVYTAIDIDLNPQKHI